MTNKERKQVRRSLERSLNIAESAVMATQLNCGEDILEDSDKILRIKETALSKLMVAKEQISKDIALFMNEIDNAIKEIS